MNVPGPTKILPSLPRLHERHRGLSPELNASFAQAAAVCLSRHHTAPVNLRLACDQQGDTECVTTWQEPDDRARESWNNETEATRDGAYVVAIAAVEVNDGLFALSRAEERTGADYYVGPPGPLNDLEDVHRLEISGIDRGGEAALKSRVQQKLDQTDASALNGPAIACVVAFKLRRIVIAHLA